MSSKCTSPACHILVRRSQNCLPSPCPVSQTAGQRGLALTPEATEVKLFRIWKYLKHIRTSPFVRELVLPYQPYQSTIWEDHLVGRTDLDPYTTPQVFESGEVKIFPHLFQSEDLGWDQAPFRNPSWHSMWQDLWGKGFRHVDDTDWSQGCQYDTFVLLYGLKGQTPYVLTTVCNLGPSRPNNGSTI